MDTTQEELIAALVRRLEGRRPHIARRLEQPRDEEAEGDVLIDLADAEVIELD